MIPNNTRLYSKDGKFDWLACNCSRDGRWIALVNLKAYGKKGRNRPKPTKESLAKIVKMIEKGELLYEPHQFDPVYIDPSLVYQDAKLAAVELEASFNYSILAEILEDPDLLERYLYTRTCAGKIKKIAFKYGIWEQHVRRMLGEYFAFGSTKYALISQDFRKGSNYSIPKSINDPGKKRGRPPVYGTQYRNKTEQDYDLVRRWIKKKGKTFCVSHSDEVVWDAYNNEVQVFLTSPPDDPEAEAVPYPLPEKYCIGKPSFINILNSIISEREAYIAEHGASNADNNYEDKTGEERQGCLRPAQTYVMDASPVNVYLLYPYKKRKRRSAGKPWIYIVKDLYSGNIVGFHISMEPPSWRGVCMALYNAFTDKKEFCAQYGITLKDGEWDCCHVCDELVIDNAGEHAIKNVEPPLLGMIGLQTIRFSRTGRGKDKGGVESEHNTLDKKFIRKLPGAIPLEENSDLPHASRASVLLYEELVRITIHGVIDSNHKARNPNKKDQHMAFEDVSATNNDIWAFGIENYHSMIELRKREPKDIIWALLPKCRASTTPEGLKVGKFLYRSPLASKAGWFVKSKNRKVKTLDVAYHWNSTNKIWFMHEGQLEVATLSSKSSRFKDMNWEIAITESVQENVEKILIKRKNREREVRSQHDINNIVDSAKERAKYLESDEAMSIERGIKERQKQLADKLNNKISDGIFNLLNPLASHKAKTLSGFGHELNKRLGR